MSSDASEAGLKKYFISKSTAKASDSDSCWQLKARLVMDAVLPKKYCKKLKPFAPKAGQLFHELDQMYSHLTY